MSLDTPSAGADIHADQRGRIIGSYTATISLTFVFVFLRLLSRKLSGAGYWWDDLLAVIATIFATICCVIDLIGLHYGSGRHIYSFSLPVGVEDTTVAMKLLFIFEIIFQIATTLAKFSVLAFYYRIFPIKRFRQLLLCVAFVSVVFLVSTVFTTTFQCRPVHYAWERFISNTKGRCINIENFFIGSGSCNVGLNLLIFILPIPLLMRLKTTVRQQIILTILFTLAGFVVIVSIIWVVVLSRVQQGDITWNYTDSGIWSVLEPSIAVICACIPSIRPLANYFASAPLLRNTLRSTGGISSSRRVMDSGKRPSDGTFTELHELDDMRPLGHDVSVRGGRIDGDLPDVEATELAQTGINVRTEVTLSTSDRLYYNDRLF